MPDLIPAISPLVTGIPASQIVAGDTIVRSAYGFDLLVEDVKEEGANRISFGCRRVRTNGSLGTRIYPVYNHHAQVQVVRSEVAA